MSAGDCGDCMECRYERNRLHIGSPCSVCGNTLTEGTVSSRGPEATCVSCAAHAPVERRTPEFGVASAEAAS